jgi:hypothetical protein
MALASFDAVLLLLTNISEIAQSSKSIPSRTSFAQTIDSWLPALPIHLIAKSFSAVSEFEFL